MKKPIFAKQIAITLLSIAPAIAQTTLLSPVPFLRPDGTIPAGMPDTGVYMDVKGDQAVVFYREDEGNAVRRLSVPLGSGVRTTVSSRVERQGANYAYTYVAANDPGAARPVARLELNDAVLGRPMALNSSSGLIAPSATGEFRLVDSRKPGLVRVVARGNVTSIELPPDLPAAIKGDLDALRRTAFPGAVAFVFGPRFEASADRADVIKEYSGAVQMLVKVGYISAESPYVQEVLKALASDSSLSGALALRTPPSSARELELDQALRIALQ